jgi:enoyl-CoA hydratase/carnithine racemase
MTDLVIISDDGPMRTVRMNRPEKKNALTLPMYDAMAGGIESAKQNPALRCLLIAGAPTVFCAGNDIGDFLGMAMGAGALGVPILRFLYALARCEATRSASAPQCSCIATMWSPPTMHASRRPSSASAWCRKRLPVS